MTPVGFCRLSLLRCFDFRFDLRRWRPFVLMLPAMTSLRAGKGWLKRTILPNGRLRVALSE